MDFDLKKALEALLLSTAEPIALKDLVKIFTRYYPELNQALEDATDGEDEQADLSKKRAFSLRRRFAIN